ncbi:hypothetical protein Tco_1101633 [Tanacetum coccineum]
MAPSFLDIEDEMERALAMEAYFNPIKNIIVFKKLIDFLGSLPVQLKNTDWGNEGYGMYKKIEGDGAWHDKFELQQKSIGTPRVADWTMFYVYSFDETLKELMKMEYLQEDEDVFVDYSWEKALSIEEDVYPEWCLEFFSTMYFERGVDRTKLMTEKYVWFRLCGREHVLTLPKFLVLLGLYDPSELDHQLFATHFSKLEIDDNLFDHDAYWKKIRKPTGTNQRMSLIQEPLIQVVHRLIVGALVHRLESKERCQKRDLWMMNALEESRGINLAWVIAEHLCEHAPGLKENSRICGGHYATKIAKSLGSMPSFGGTSIVPSSGYEVGGSSRAIQDEDDDDASMSEQRVHTDDDMRSEED